MDQPFKLGFMGTTTDQVLFHAAELVVGDHIYMPFTGSGKDISWLSQEGRTIISADTQYLSSLMVDGVFNSKGESVVIQEGTELPQDEGWAVENVPFKRMTNYALRVIDGIAMHGNDFDRAVLCKATISSTIGGRLTHWEVSDDQFAAKIRRAALAMQEFTDLPGVRIHYYDTCFGVNPSFEGKPSDTIWIDPPKVVDTQDVYSRTFWKLNSLLAQKTVELPKWKYPMMIPNLKKLWELPCKRIIQFYCSDVRPTDDQVRTELAKYGEIQERVRFLHGSKADYIHIVDKG